MTYYSGTGIIDVGRRLNEHILFTDTLCYPGLFAINSFITCKTYQGLSQPFIAVV